MAKSYVSVEVLFLLVIILSSFLPLFSCTMVFWIIFLSFFQPHPIIYTAGHTKYLRAFSITYLSPRIYVRSISVILGVFKEFEAGKESE